MTRDRGSQPDDARALRHRQGGLRHVAGGPRGREDPRRPHPRGVGLHRPRRWRRTSRSPSRRSTLGRRRRTRASPGSSTPTSSPRRRRLRARRHDPRLCRSGGRAAIAINARARRASRTSTTSSTGWRAAGSTTPTACFHGMRLKNGWKASGLPWTYDLDPDRMWIAPPRTRTRARLNVNRRPIRTLVNECARHDRR